MKLPGTAPVFFPCGSYLESERFDRDRVMRECFLAWNTAISDSGPDSGLVLRGLCPSGTLSFGDSVLRGLSNLEGGGVGQAHHQIQAGGSS